MSLRAYYEDELAYLRELGVEFAKFNPKLAPFLGREASDPDVERLLEGFAFLVARLRLRLGNELPELSHALLRLVWPHYLRPIPPLTIIAFEPSLPTVQSPINIVGGAQIRSRRIEGTSCPFETVHSIDVVPLNVVKCQLDNRQATSRLSLQFRSIGKASLQALSSGRLRLFLGAERDTLSAQFLLVWLLRHVNRIEAVNELGNQVSISPDNVRPVGFADNEAVLDWPDNSFSGFRVLQEYLTFPARFMFVDVTGLEPLAALGGKSFALNFEFNRKLPDEIRVSDDQIKLNCVPARNLFTYDANPIRIDQTKSEYRVIPTGGTSIYSLNSIVEVVGFKQGRPERRIYVPFESFRHDLPGESVGGLFYRERVRSSVVGRGVDTYIGFSNRLDSIVDPEAEIISVKLKCTNGPIADRLAIGSIDQNAPDTPNGVKFRNIISVSSEVPPPVDDALLWRLISGLSRNYGSFANVNTLRQLIASYDFRAISDDQSRRRLELLLESFGNIANEQRDTVVRGIPARMNHFTLSIFESKIGNEAEMFLLGSVLDAFFASYAGINSLHQFAVRGEESKALYEWPMRFGATNRF